VSAPHGTNARYAAEKCRCADCRRAAAAYAAQRRLQQAHGRPRLVDPEPVRAHVRSLRAAGMPLRGIERAAGLARGSLHRLLRPTGQRIHRHTEARILTLVPRVSPSAVVPALGTRRRVQALACHGWSLRLIAHRAGLDPASLTRAIHGNTVRASTAESVSTTYERLWNAPAPERSSREKAAATTARRHAAESGWAPPMAWDDHKLDEPHARPAGTARRATERTRCNRGHRFDGHRTDRDCGGQTCSRCQARYTRTRDETRRAAA
jgi:lambda repressor-like predicted transcriptional regulator